jgi:exodeoxyribonuclease VIII
MEAYLDHSLSIEEYHAMKPISKSGLDSIDLSPAIYYARHVDPNRPARGAKSGQLEGNLAHCAILEPESFGERYVIGPSVNRNTKVWKEFVEANPESTVIQQDQADTAMRQAESIRGLPEVGAAFAVGKPEVSAFWRDADTGVECRCRPDWVHPVGEESVILLDVKTYSNASANEFNKQVARKRYDVQAAFYSDGYAAASGLKVLGFVFVAVETEWPHAANAFMLDAQGLAAGREKYMRNLRTYAECLRTGNYPGYSTGINVISLPSWALATTEE